MIASDLSEENIEVIKEKVLNKIIYNQAVKKNKSFAYAESQLWFSQLKFIDDLLFIQTTLISWMDKLKDNDSIKRNLINKIFLNVFSIDTYAVKMEVLIKETIEDYLDVKKEIEDLKYSKIKAKIKSEQKQKEYKSIIENLEKEIKFINRK